MMKVVFLFVHPDDIEFFTPHLVHYIAKKSHKDYDIRIACMTRGEYGVPKSGFDRFKGERLGRIRTRELYKAQEIHGIKPGQIHFFGIIDGYMTFNKRTVELVKEYLNTEKPQIIFTCEPRNTYYRHPDHMNVGKTVYYILDKGIVNFKPKLYFFSSINPNFYWPFKKDEIPFAARLLHTHQSQAHLWKFAGPLYKIIGRIYGRRIKGWKYAEGYRRVYYGKEISKNKKLRFLQRLLLILNVKVWPEKVTNHSINLEE